MVAQRTIGLKKFNPPNPKLERSVSPIQYVVRMQSRIFGAFDSASQAKEWADKKLIPAKDYEIFSIYSMYVSSKGQECGSVYKSFGDGVI
jgi:hypothetical protein